jgi:hypothetical protein
MRCFHVDSVKVFQQKLGGAAALDPAQRLQQFPVLRVQPAQFGGGLSFAVVAEVCAPVRFKRIS